MSTILINHLSDKKRQKRRIYDLDRSKSHQTIWLKCLSGAGATGGGGRVCGPLFVLVIFKPPSRLADQIIDTPFKTCKMRARV